MIDLQVAFDKLAGFDTHGEIARFLREEGIQGELTNGKSCPLAVWMASVTGQAIYVGREHMRSFRGGFPMMAWQINMEYEQKINLTGAMQRFVHWFDRGGYPGLISPGPSTESDPF